MTKNTVDQRDDPVEEDGNKQAQVESEAVQHSDTPIAPTGRLKRYWRWASRHKKVTIPAVFVLLLAVLAAVPATRYFIAGTVLTQQFGAQVTDQETGKPVSGVRMTLMGKTALTDKDGRVSIRARVGYGTLQIEKKYYQTTQKEVLVPIGKQARPFTLSIKATGRQVPVTVTDNITKKPLANVVFRALGTETKTGQDGKVVLVLPPNKTKVEAEIQYSGYNAKTVQVQVITKAVAANNFSLTPSGTVHFLSKLSGNIDVVSANLDGTGRKTLLAGTGNEDTYNTELYESGDAKYLVLLSRRDGGEHAKLFLLETATGKLSTIDEGQAVFRVYDWAGHRLIYEVERENKDYDAPGKYAIKSFDAAAKKITTIDETSAHGGLSQRFGQVYAKGEALVYAVYWSGYAYLDSWPSAIRTVQIDGTQKKNIKTFDYVQYSNEYIDSTPHGVDEIYFSIWNQQGGEQSFFGYKDGAVTLLTIDRAAYERSQGSWRSPSREKIVRFDYRDGERFVFVADKDGGNEKQVAKLGNAYAFHAWHGDDYLLFTKQNELYIMHVEGLGSAKEPAKITSIHR